MVVEDALHTYDCTIGNLRAYANLVTSGCYLVVEDTNFNHGLPGPAVVEIKDDVEIIYWDQQDWYKLLEGYKAVEDFIKEDGRYEIDRSREAFFITGNPKGYLRKK